MKDIRAMSSATSLDDLWPDPDRRDAALEHCLIRVHTQSGEPPTERTVLTKKEWWALNAAAAGMDWNESADILGVTPYQVQDSLKRARRVLAAKTTAHAVAIALRQGLIR